MNYSRIFLIIAIIIILLMLTSSIIWRSSNRYFLSHEYPKRRQHNDTCWGPWCPHQHGGLYPIPSNVPKRRPDNRQHWHYHKGNGVPGRGGGGIPHNSGGIPGRNGGGILRPVKNL